MFYKVYHDTYVSKMQKLRKNYIICLFFNFLQFVSYFPDSVSHLLFGQFINMNSACYIKFNFYKFVNIIIDYIILYINTPQNALKPSYTHTRKKSFLIWYKHTTFKRSKTYFFHQRVNQSTILENQLPEFFKSSFCNFKSKAFYMNIFITFKN